MDGAIAHDLEKNVERTSDVAAGSVSFKDLNLKGHLIKCLQLHKFITPTKIQAAAIPIAFAGMDLLVQSKSGTGKTLIYVLAALQMMDSSVAKPQALIIVPTRELAIQVEDTVNSLVSSLRSKSAYLSVSFIGGTDVTKDRIRMSKGRIVVGTPGRLLHLIHNNVFDTTAIKLLVLDEADQLFATDSLKKDVQLLLRAPQLKVQIIACSATYPNSLDERLAEIMNNPILVSNSERATVLLGIRQFVYELPEQQNSMQEMLAKLAALHTIFGQVSYEQAILFASSQSRADSFRNYLQRDGVDCDLMSGSMKQNERLETFKAYRNFQMRTLVATDLMARGVDSSHANLVINLDPPNDLVTYLHRIGRAGRFGSKGIAITFIASSKQLQHFKRMIADVGTGMSVLQFPTEKREGFDFWNYDSYDFPYFQKSESCKSEESESNRNNNLWNAPNHLQHTVGISENNFKNQSADDVHSPVIPIIAGNMEPPKQNESKNDEAKEIQEQQIILNIEENTQINPKQTPKAEVNKENEFVNSTQKLKPTDSRNINETKTGVYENSPELQESPIDPTEVTPSVEIPAAAPNSINTKTYCLIAPTECSSTTLHPLAVSNTVDDASSIISDSMENEYDSDASYSSFYSESDAQFVMHRALAQKNIQKRQQRNARRQSYLFNWHNPNYRLCKKPSKKYHFCSKEIDIEDTNQLEKWQDEEPKTKLPLLRLKLKEVTYSDCNPQLNKLCSNLLKKFKNIPKVQTYLNSYVKKPNTNIQRHEQWMDHLYKAMCHLHQVNHSKSKLLQKPIMPDVSNLTRYNELMEFLNGVPPKTEQPETDKEVVEQPHKSLGKLSLHVNQQMNIPPVNMVVLHNAEAPSENSSDGHSQSEYTDEASVESSGFVESTESASSGIETSQYDSNSSMAFDLDDYDEEEEATWNEEDTDDTVEEQSDSSQATSSSKNKPSESDDSASGSDVETEIHEDAITSNARNVNDVASQLALSQSRWQFMFQMQYQFIANYVENYLAIYRRQY